MNYIIDFTYENHSTTREIKLLQKYNVQISKSKENYKYCVMTIYN